MRLAGGREAQGHGGQSSDRAAVDPASQAQLRAAAPRSAVGRGASAGVGLFGRRGAGLRRGSPCARPGEEEEEQRPRRRPARTGCATRRRRSVPRRRAGRAATNRSSAGAGVSVSAQRLPRGGDARVGAADGQTKRWPSSVRRARHSAAAHGLSSWKRARILRRARCMRTRTAVTRHLEARGRSRGRARLRPRARS